MITNYLAIVLLKSHFSYSMINKVAKVFKFEKKGEQTHIRISLEVKVKRASAVMRAT